jgi:apoptosis-inducing factor 3
MPQLEAVVASVNDLQNGEMRQVSVGETDVLLARFADKYYAVGAYCTHYQAPLAEGVLCENHVVCPWHNAYFNLTTGEQQEPPGLDSLQTYSVRIEGDRVIVRISENASGRRQPHMAESNPEDGRTFVIIGAGAAGAHAAQTLRVAGYQGQIVMVTQEDRLPYDRTWLSKDYLTGKVTQDEMPLRSAQFYQDCQIEVWLNKQVVRVDVNTQLIFFADGEPLQYDALLLATGGKPRQLDVPGSDLQNIFTVRSFADTDRILAVADNAKRAVVIGSSFIGMEAAAGLTQRGLEVTVVSPSTLPFEKILGAEIGKVFQQVHQENGVKFHLGRKATRMEGDGKVEAVVLDNGDRLDADLVVVGIGVRPATEFLQGLELHPKDGSVQVDEYLQAADRVYAAGDIARYPDWRTGELTRIEHWRVAAQHGRIAAYNMAGQQAKYRSVPIFWTMQFQFPLRYVGHAEQWDEIIVRGDLQQQEFIAFYVQGDRVLAAAASQRDTEAAAIVELMRLDRMPSPEELRRPDLNLVAMLRS